MKTIINLFFIGLLAFVFACKPEQKSNPNEVIISGQIINPTGDSVWVRTPDQFDYPTVSASALDSNGGFTMTFTLEKPTEASFYDGKETSKMFLKPGDSLLVSLDTEQFDESIRYIGKGSNENNYLAEAFLKFDDEGKQEFYTFIREGGSEAVMSYLDSVALARMNFFEDYKNKNELSQDFLDWQINDILFAETNMYASHFYAKYAANNYTLDTVNVPKTFYERYKGFMQKDTGIHSSNFNGYIMSFYYYYVRQLNRDRINSSKNKDSLTLILIKEYFPQKYGEIVLSKLVVNNLKGYKSSLYENNAEAIKAYITNTDYLTRIEEEYNKLMKLFELGIPEGTTVVDLTTPEYNDFSFQDLIDKYKGKVIYLDFWASWCGPCKGEMPNSKILKKKLEGKDVAFVYLSSDKDSLAWINTIKVMQLGGDQYRMSREVRKQGDEIFNVRYIPRYVIYDKEGMVVDSTATRPSNPETLELLESLL